MHRGGGDPLAACYAALDRGEILIFFPEGSRGAPERMSTFKNGLARLAEHRPDVPVVPVFLHGLGKSLPKGKALFVPFFCDVFVGEPMVWSGDKAGFMSGLKDRIVALAGEERRPDWA